MSLGPLGRLTLFGWLCPCHESDDEFLARRAIGSLQATKVQWLRVTSQSMSLQKATIKILDRPLGPALQLISTCSNNNNITSSDVTMFTNHGSEPDDVEVWSQFQTVVGNKRYIEIPLSRIDRMELHRNENTERIHIYAYYDNDNNKHHDNNNNSKAKSKLLLQLTTTDPMTLQDLTTVLHWDRVRRADLESTYEHWEAMQRLREEQKRLKDENEPRYE
jgi:hypothetical protein